MPLKNNDLGSYQAFLQTFLDREYQFVFFQDQNQPYRQIILRHDIDFDTDFALKTAQIEADLGVRATYFFLLCSDLYNALSASNFENICRIKEMGHDISLHFDPLIYEEFQGGFKREVNIFQEYFETEVRVISIHRPNQFFQEYNMPIMGIEHAYQSKYFHDIKYFSDSTGEWRFGHPFDSEEFMLKKSFQILIHPIWWMMEGKDKHDKLRQYFSERVSNLKTDFNNNCVPFREIYENL